jgi:UMF1 family MFS transporter
MSDDVRGNRRVIFGWAVYDWANSAYATTLVTALLPIYFAEVVVPRDFTIGGTAYAAETLWGYLIGASALFVFLAAPTLGAISDFASSKKRFLVGFCYFGVVNALLLWFCNAGDVWRTVFLFICAHVGFVGANVFYDAFLPQIAPDGKQDWVSAKGFSFGYLGGGLQFLIALGLIAGHDAFGMTTALAAKVGMMMSAIWWGGFGLITAFLLKEPRTVAVLPAPYCRYPLGTGYIAFGCRRVWRTSRRVGQMKHLLLFLIAFMIYNDGIQTVVEMAAIYGKQELGLDSTALMLTLLVVQFVALAGSLAAARAAERFGTRRTIMATLVGWSIVVIYAYFIHTATEYFVLGGVVGLVLGGSQALSRSFFGSMIPVNASAEFFGFYSVFNKFSSIWGPVLFGFIRHTTGSSRNAIISLMAFFIIGIVLLSFVDEVRARRASAEIAVSSEAT